MFTTSKKKSGRENKSAESEEKKADYRIVKGGPGMKWSLHVTLTREAGISTEPHGESTNIALEHSKLKIIFFVKRK